MVDLQCVSLPQRFRPLLLLDECQLFAVVADQCKLRNEAEVLPLGVVPVGAGRYVGLGGAAGYVG